MSRYQMRLAALAALLILPTSGVFAHCFVGARFLPATLGVDDPCVADELSLPTVSAFKNGDDPSARELDISGEFSKKITDTFGISIASSYDRIRSPGMPTASGFENLETSFKWQLLTVPEREFVMSTALVVEWGNTGSSAIGADPFTTVTPTVYFGKGFGDLTDTVSWARPIALTGQFGYSIPTNRTTTTIDPDSGDISIDHNPQFFTYGGSLQYSLPYLKSNVVDLNLPDFVNHLIPIVEAQFQTPMANNFEAGLGATGTINPGFIWVGDYYQVGLEAVIPVNRASGGSVGVIAQLHIYLDDIFPNTIGRPLLSSITAARRPLGR